ncbi:MAG: glycosyltransferase family 4 protein [Muribaculaceae bacterium]|nr:glycosyltransferase family 4 protein [Muribaculaceae bacterium]
MNIIFLTLSHVLSVSERGIYADLMRKFRDNGHNVYMVTSSERRFGIETSLKDTDGVQLLNVKTLNIQKTNVVEKGIGTLLIESQYKQAIKKHLKDVKFDLILYTTPPITLTSVVKYLKKKNPQAVTYLLMKDIFPQNAVDLGMFGTDSLFYKYFRRTEKELYAVSDYVGCMSPANVDYLKRHNPEIDPDTVEVAPNSLELVDMKPLDKNVLREKYGLPTDRPILIYGGNLGKPQGIDYLLRCLDANKGRTDCHFLIIGNGTEYGKIEAWYEANKGGNVTVMQRLPKEDYDDLVRSCDVGLIFLDHRFTIPNYPSRLLSYLENKMPVIAATDVNTDIGSIAEENGYGLCCESREVADFTACVNDMIAHPDKMREMGERGFEFLKENYVTDVTYGRIMAHVVK